MPPNRALRMSRLLGAGVLVVSLAVLLGWYLHVTALQSVAPGLASMKPNTALGLGALGLLTALPPARRRALALGGAVGLLGAATLAEYALDSAWGIDLLLPWVDLQGDSARMAPATAVALTVLGLGHVLGATGRGRTSRVLALGGFGLGWVAVLGYIYGVSQLYRVGGYTSMALHTALSLTALSVALLLRDPDQGLVAMLRSDGSTGRMMRALAPFVLIVPALLGWVRLQAQEAGLFDTAFGVAALITAMTVLGLGLTWRLGLRLHIADTERDRAAAELRKVNASLEETVSVRTKELEASRDRLRTLLELAPVAIVELDAHGGIVDVNAQWTSLTGLDPATSGGTGWTAAVLPEDLPESLARLAEAVRSAQPQEHQLRVRRPDGGVRWVQARTAPLHEGGEVIGHLGTLTDVTDLEEARQESAAARERFERVFASSPLGAALISPDATVVAVNDQLAELLESPEEVLLGADLATAFSVDADASAWLMEALQDPGGIRRTEVMTETLHGRSRCLDLHAVALADAAHGQVVLLKVEDITARREAERRVEHLALHDSLTGLPNRVLLLDRLTQELRQIDRRDGGVGVVFLDLDRFKEVNDQLGHDAGDYVLTTVARRLREAARRTDTVARLGGDEFVVVCPGMRDVEALRAIAATLAEAVQEEILYGGRSASVGASIGVAVGTTDDDAAALIQTADQAMYLAKQGGRSRVEVFDGDLRVRLQARHDLETALRSAVEGGHVTPWFQSIVDLRTGAVVGREALARWLRPGRGVVLPTEFIRVAEESELISDLGAVMLRQACAGAVSWGRDEWVSVNVSPHQFVSHDFGRIVDEALALSGLPSNLLWLELTESAVTEAIDSSAALFQRLRNRGVRIAVDDFGTGYSSFARLRQFPVDVVKLDATFVREVATDDRDAHVVGGIVQLAAALGMTVVAECVETVEQRDRLVDLGCDLGQGFLFARPAPLRRAVPHPRKAGQQVDSA